MHVHTALREGVKVAGFIYKTETSALDFWKLIKYNISISSIKNYNVKV